MLLEGYWLFLCLDQKQSLLINCFISEYYHSSSFDLTTIEQKRFCAVKIIKTIQIIIR